MDSACSRPTRASCSSSCTPTDFRGDAALQEQHAGLSDREIAQNLFITARTVEGHISHAYRKLAITTREQLLAALTPPGRRPPAGIPPSATVTIACCRASGSTGDGTREGVICVLHCNIPARSLRARNRFGSRTRRQR